MTFILLAVGLFALSEANENPCIGYETLSEVRRSILYSSKLTEPDICDRERIDEAKWYRFTVLPPSRIHDECIEQLKCGTERPIWIRGEHPTENDPGPKSVDVCSPRENDCCGGWQSTIMVKYCKAVVAGDVDFYVYRLKRVPECAMAYCAGSEIVCEQGTVNNHNSKSCTEPFPILATPVLDGPILERKTLKMNGEKYDDFYFSCKIGRNMQPDPDGATKGQRYEVVFTFDGEKVESVPPTITSKFEFEAIAWSRELKGQVGKTVGCMARSYWNGLEKQKSNYMRASGNYFIGLQYSMTGNAGTFTNPAIIIHESSPPSTIYFKSTVPISCPETNFRTFCKIEVYVDDIPPKDDIGVGSCLMVYSGWVTGKNSSTLTVRALPTPGIHHRTSVISFKPIVADYDFFWDGYQAPDIYIKVVDASMEYCCESIGDPHFKTFDGRGYDHYMEGDFVLAKSTLRHFEVHVRQHKCWAVTCNCAVAVREGNNVLGINACLGQPPTPMVYAIDEANPGTIMTNVGNSYSITMPSGASVRVVYHGIHLAIYVCLNSEDFYKTSGLCGNLNGNWIDDELPLHAHARGHQATYTNSYSLSQKESLINALIYPITCYDTDTDLSSIYCCQKDNPTPCISLKLNKIGGITTKFYANYTNFCKEKIQQNRKRRDAGQNDTIEGDDIDEMMISADEFPMPTFDENHGKDVVLRWPTPSGITEEEAVRRCTSKLESSAVFTACKNSLAQEDRNLIINNCVLDLQVSDDIDMAVGYVIDSFQKQCLTIMENAVTTNRTNDTNSEPPSALELLLSEVLSKICPNQCSGKGNCSNGTCICRVGLAGEDCSVNTTLPPSLSSFRKGPICDSRSTACSQTSIFASNFYSSSNFICKVTEIEKNREFRYSGSIVSGQEIACKFPLVHRFSSNSRESDGDLKVEPAPYYRWDIAISNDAGRFYSNNLRLTVFDSKCQNCSAEGECVLKENTCVIDGKCYSAEEGSSHDAKLKCCPSKSQNKWMTCGVASVMSRSSLINALFIISMALINLL